MLTLSLELKPEVAAELDPPLWTLGHVAWFQERWVARNVQRARGEHADADAAPLASIVADADRWYDDAAVDRAERRRLAASTLPDLQATRTFLVESLETTLELLGGAEESDDGLYFFRLALFHEAMQAERFAELAQTLGLDLKIVARLATQAPRPALLFPATRWLMGASGDGFAFDNERPAHVVDVPEFEIDAQAVTWAQYGEFVEDGGYDEARFWSAEGWAWVEREGRRTPRHVDQIRHGVLQRRFGQLARVPLAQPAMHLAWYEADAWCRWAGRRLPAEVEWEAASLQGASRGFRFGDVREWTASTFRPYPGFVAGPWRRWSVPAFGVCKVWRGGSFATAPMLVHPRFRGFAPPDADGGFFGFRSCAP